MIPIYILQQKKKLSGIINEEDRECSVIKDGYVFLSVSAENSPSYPVARLTINELEVVMVTCASANVSNTGISYTSPLFPVKAGDAITTIDCGLWDVLECKFIPFR